MTPPMLTPPLNLDAENWRKSKKFAQNADSWDTNERKIDTFGIRGMQTLIINDRDVIIGRQLFEYTYNCYANSELHLLILTNHDDFSRHEITINLLEPFATANIYFFGISKMNLTDGTITINHLAKQTNSHTICRMRAEHELGTGVMQVLANIAKDCQGCKVVQDIKGLILAPNAEIFAKPELAIDHDQVEAKHGCSIGGINEAEIFYLQSRGIAKDLAKNILAQGFMQSAISQIHTDFQGITENFLK